MTKDECLALLQALGKEDWDVVEFPVGSGMYILVCSMKGGQ